MTSPLKIEGTPFCVWENCKFTHVDDFTILTQLKVFVSSLVSVLTRHNISVTAHRIYNVDFFSDNNLRAKKSSIIKRVHANKDGGFVDKFPNIDTIYLVKYALVPIKCHCH